MSAMAHDNQWTEAEYLEMERASEIKHEYYQGEIYAMAGASRNHNRIVMSVSGNLYTQLRGKTCEPFASDMRVKVSAASLYTYPDITVVCDDPQFEDDGVDTLLNPTLIVEVLSSSTERYDRGKKFQQYRMLSLLQEYVLISQDTARIERYLRVNEQWVLTDAVGLEAEIELESINCRLLLADVYERVEFEQHAEDANNAD